VSLGFGPGAALLLALGAASSASGFDESRYVGHLVLDRTTVVITEAVGELDVPWELAAAPDGWIWFTQLEGTVHRYDPESGEVQELLAVPDVFHRKSLGLLGMALHPDFVRKPFVLLHHTYRELAPDRTEILRSRLVRYRFEGGALRDPAVLLDAIPGATYHNGSRIVVTADDHVFLSTGDAGDPDGAQDPAALHGKVLRLGIDGRVPDGNPFADSPVWSRGHRNVQGLVLTRAGALYASEHGPNNDDEINRIEPGRNYGWPLVEGFVDTEWERRRSAGTGIAEPLFAWTPTVAAAGLEHYESPAIPEWRGSLLVANLKGRALRVLQLDAAGGSVATERIYFQKRFGRLRDVCATPAGDVYVSTSNRDWHPRFQPRLYDSLPEGPDRILRLRAAGPAELAQLARLPEPAEIREDPQAMELLSEDWSYPATGTVVSEGERLYTIHCASCHLPNGAGVPGLVPPLTGTDWVAGDKSRLIQVVLGGLSVPIEVGGERYDQEMPGYATRSDEEIAAILTFVRDRFGDGADAVIAGEVYEERKVAP
jgi:glucose/arabinose dehydrogenase